MFYWVTLKLPQIYTENHAIFQIRIRKITVHICGNFWVTQYIAVGAGSSTVGNGTKLILVWNSYQKLGKQEHKFDNSKHKLIMLVIKAIWD